MDRNVIDKLNQIELDAINHAKAPADLVNRITNVCHPQFDINKLYNELGLIAYSDAVDLLSNNVIAANRQHDLNDAEYFREQKELINNSSSYYMETIHGCHIAPTVHSVTYRDVLHLINVIKHKG